MINKILLDSLYEHTLNLSERVQAVDAVSDAIQGSRAGLGRSRLTHCASCSWAPQVWARQEPLQGPRRVCMFNDENAIVRIDMSEYMEKHVASH
jgi:hypothetical protein